MLSDKETSSPANSMCCCVNNYRSFQLAGSQIITKDSKSNNPANNVFSDNTITQVPSIAVLYFSV